MPADMGDSHGSHFCLCGVVAAAHHPQAAVCHRICALGSGDPTRTGSLCFVSSHINSPGLGSSGQQQCLFGEGLLMEGGACDFLSPFPPSTMVGASWCIATGAAVRVGFLGIPQL